MTLVSDLLNELEREPVRAGGPDPWHGHAFPGMPKGQLAALEARGFKTYSGKVRDLVAGKSNLFMVHSDRLSAFDRFIGLVPYKGTMLTSISNFWLKKASEVVETHLRGAPHERVLTVAPTDPIKIEVVVRGYLAGSMLRAYEKGERLFCGVRLPEGLKPYGPLPTPIITPTTKAAAFEHDENASPQELVAQGICSQEEWDTLASMAHKIFEFGQRVFSDVGWILVDTKYEFGRSLTDGRVILIDEIHTPDSSRLWVASSYESLQKRGEAPEMLDKETIRRYLLGLGFSGHGEVPAVPRAEFIKLARVYLAVAERLCGKPLETVGAGQVVADGIFTEK